MAAAVQMSGRSLRGPATRFPATCSCVTAPRYPQAASTTPCGPLYGANVPDLRDRFLLGASGTHALRSIGGEATHTLTEAEIPSHNHLGSGFAINVPGGSDATAAGLNGGGNQWVTGNRGGGGAHNNIPPFYVVRFVIVAIAAGGGGGGAGSDGDRLLSIFARTWDVDNTFMDGSTDLTLTDTETFPFPTVSTVEASGIHIRPDRAVSCWANIWTTNRMNPANPANGATMATTPVVASGGANWTGLGSISASQEIPADTQAIWVLRLVGVQGGATGVSYRAAITRNRYRL